MWPWPRRRATPSGWKPGSTLTASSRSSISLTGPAAAIVLRPQRTRAAFSGHPQRTRELGGIMKTYLALATLGALLASTVALAQPPGGGAPPANRPPP